MDDDIVMVKAKNEIRYTFRYIEDRERHFYEKSIFRLFRKHVSKGFNRKKYEREAQEYKDILIDDIYEQSVFNIEDIETLRKYF